MRKLLFYQMFISLLLSCTSAKRIAGVYEIENNKIEYTKLYLNSDGSFAQFINTSGCEPMWYFGFFDVVGKKIRLQAISSDVRYLNKNQKARDYAKADTAIYLHDPDISESKLYLYLNEREPLVKYVKDHRIQIDRNKIFNQVFIMLYDYAGLDCTKVAFSSSYIIKRDRLVFFPNWERKESPVQVFLLKRK